MDPEVAALSAQLAPILAKNAAATISTRIDANRKGKAQDEQISDLLEIIQELISERSQLVSIAQGYESVFAAQRISDVEIAYITDTLIPVVERFATGSEYGSDDSHQAAAARAEAAEAVDILKDILSPKILSIMQLIGFNYRDAIGQPLTDLVRRLILAKAPVGGGDQSAHALLAAQREVAYLQMVQDPDAWARFQSLRSQL